MLNDINHGPAHLRNESIRCHSLEQATGRFDVLSGYLCIRGGKHPERKVELDTGSIAVKIGLWIKDASGQTYAEEQEHEDHVGSEGTHEKDERQDSPWRHSPSVSLSSTTNHQSGSQKISHSESYAGRAVSMDLSSLTFLGSRLTPLLYCTGLKVESRMLERIHAILRQRLRSCQRRRNEVLRVDQVCKRQVESAERSEDDEWERIADQPMI